MMFLPTGNGTQLSYASLLVNISQSGILVRASWSVVKYDSKPV